MDPTHEPAAPPSHDAGDVSPSHGDHARPVPRAEPTAQRGVVRRRGSTTASGVEYSGDRSSAKGVELRSPTSSLREKLLQPGSPASDSSGSSASHSRPGEPTRRRGRCRFYAARHGDCCSPPDLTREHVQNRYVLLALLIVALSLTARQSVSSHYFVLPLKVSGPKHIEFQCPLIQPDLPSKQGFLKQLREQLMPIVMESGILWNPQTVNYKLLAEEALKATLQTAEAVYLPALRHAVFTNRLPGTPAGRGENSECDYAWFNVTSALGMQPPPVVRGLGVQLRGQPNAVLDVSIATMELDDNDELKLTPVTTCSIKADGGGNAPMWHLLRGYPPALYNITVTSTDRSAGLATGSLVVPVTGDPAPASMPESFFPVKHEHPQVCPYPASADAFSSPSGDGHVSAQPSGEAPSPRGARRTAGKAARRVEDSPTLALLHAPPSDETVYSGGWVNITVQASTNGGLVASNVPVVAWLDVVEATSLVDGAFKCASASDWTMTALTNSSGMASFIFRITELFCVGTMRANSKVAGTAVGVSTVFPVDRSTSRVYFKVQLPDLMRVGAGGPYGATLHSESLAVNSQLQYHASDPDGPAQKISDIIGHSTLLESAAVPEFKHVPVVCIDPPGPGKKITPFVLSVPAVHQVVDVMKLYGDAMNSQWLSDMHVNTSLARVVLSSMIGIPHIYSAVGIEDLELYPKESAFSTAVYPVLQWNHSKLTDDTGCVSFEDLQWVTGSIGPALVLFEAEGNTTYQLTMLVNADQPQPAELGFIYEQGLYDNFWILFWAMLMLLTCCLNKRCDLCGHLCSCFFLTLTFATYYTMAFVLNWFYVETISDSPYPVVGYMAACCQFTPATVATDGFSILIGALSFGAMVYSWVALTRKCCLKKGRERAIMARDEFSWAQEAASRVNSSLTLEHSPKAAYTAPPVAQGRPDTTSSPSPDTKYVPLEAVDLEDALPHPDGRASRHEARLATEAGMPKPADGATPTPLVFVDAAGSQGGSAVYAQLYQRAQRQEQRRRQTGCCSRMYARWVSGGGFDDVRLEVFRRAMPDLLRMVPRAKNAPQTRVASALKTKATSSWMSYRGSMFAVVWRFYTAFKLAFMSMFYAVAAAWWLLYTVFIVTPTLLVCTQSMPRAHLNCCWSCFKNVFIAGIQCAILVLLLFWEVLVLLWASLMDSMPFMPTNANLPLADADDQAYAESDFRKTKSGRIVQRDNSCSGVAKRLAVKRGRWCRRLFCNPREHGGTVGGNYVWTDTVEVKQAEVQTRLWRWILDKEDTRYGVRRKSTVRAFSGIRNWAGISQNAGLSSIPGLTALTNAASSRIRSARGGNASARQPVHRKLGGDEGGAERGADVDAEAKARHEHLRKLRLARRPIVDLPVYFPQRFLWSCVVSMFSVSLICMVGDVMAWWLNEVFKEAIHAYKTIESQVTLHLPLQSIHPPVSRLEYVMSGYLLTKFEALVGSGTYKIIMSIVPLGVPGALLIVWLVNVCVWIRMAVVYRQRILALRLGKDPVERKQASSVTAPMYIGYQLVHSMVGAVFLSVIVVTLVVFIVVLILVKPLQASLASYTLTAGLALLPSVLVWLATRLWGMFLARDLRLVYPVMFTHYDAIAMINNMIIGLFVVLKRVLILFGYITVSFWRLDLLAGGSVTFDSGYGAYLSMLMMDHHNNNPVKLVFLDLVQKEINVLRALKHGGLVKGSVNNQCYSMTQFDTTYLGWLCCLPCLCQVCTAFGHQRSKHHAKGKCNVARRVLRQRIIQRWHLYVMLIRNPSLQLYRKHRLKAITSFKKLALTATAVGTFQKIQHRGTWAPWAGQRLGIGDTDQFSYSARHVLVVANFVNVFKSEDAQSPSRTIAFVSIGAVKPLAEVLDFRGCKHKYGFAIRALHAWHAFGVKDKEEQQQWIALLRNEMVTASIASAIAMGGNELVGR